MEIEFQNTRKDYIDSFKLTIRNRAKKKLIYPFFIFIMAIFFASSEKYGVPGYLLTLTGYFIFIVLTGYYIPLLLTIIKFNKLVAKEDGSYTVKRTLTISDEGIRTESEKFNLLRSWDSVTRVISNEKFVYIYLADKKNLLIPKRHFSSQIDVANFIGLIESYIIKTKGSLNAHTSLGYVTDTKAFSQKSKLPYLLGLLCVIPFLGAFVGIGFLIYGIFVYKDKWVSLIGAGGILFTVFVFYSMSPSGFDNDQFKKGFAESDKTELNSIVKELEFYKLQNGSYPDDLHQLDTKGSFTIYDPLLYLHTLMVKGVTLLIIIN